MRFDGVKLVPVSTLQSIYAGLLPVVIIVEERGAREQRCAIIR